MSRHYGLDRHTPKNVYVPDMTQNKVIASTAEEPIDEENEVCEHCGCADTGTPGGFSRIGAPGGPNLGGSNLDDTGPAVDDGMGDRVVLFDTDPETHEESAPGGYDHPDFPHDEDYGSFSPSRHDNKKEDDHLARRAAEEEEGRHDRHASDFKPRVHESFGDVITDDWLEIG